MKPPIISGRYELKEIVGTGGMSVVYRAWDLKYDREVAVKVLRREYIEDQDFIRRFDHEAQAASKMSHPNIVNMLDVGQDGEIRYIVMEYVKGQTLKELIRKSGRIRPARAIQMTMRILAAVDHAHRNHIVHRDIKPQNILVDENGVVKVADFGIARLTTSSSTLTQNDGNVLGSVHYFSPEQANGLVADEKSDLYSVGVVLYEMVTGQVPFDGDSPISVALKHVREAPRSTRTLNPEISRGLDEVILKALDKDSARRYQSAAEMAQDLKKAVRMPGGGFVRYPDMGGASVHGQQQESPRPAKRKRRVWPIVLCLVVLLVLIGVGLLMTVGRSMVNDLLKKLYVPNVVMMESEQAQQTLKDAGLSSTLASRHDASVDRGLVIEQNPAAGSLIWPGSSIRIVVSEGKEMVMMPSLLECTRAEAVSELEARELKLEIVVLEISDAPPGTVISQLPKANEWVAPGTGVELHISGESAPVPELTGKTLEEAEDALHVAGFGLGTVTEQYSADARPGQIIGQSILPQTVTLLGTPVGVTVCQALPDTYRKQVDFELEIKKDQSRVTIMQISPSSGAREVYSQLFDKGKQHIKLDLDSAVEETCELKLYVNSEEVASKQIVFEAQEG